VYFLSTDLMIAKILILISILTPCLIIPQEVSDYDFTKISYNITVTSQDGGDSKLQKSTHGITWTDNVTEIKRAAIPKAKISIDYDNIGAYPAPIFEISPSSLDFGPVVITGFATLQATVSNPGTDPLDITNITSSDPQFTISPLTAIVPPSSDQIFDITFTPTSLGSQSADIEFTHNALGSPTLYQVHGVGADAGPTFGVSPTSLNFGTLLIGNNLILQLTVRNDGLSNTMNITSASATIQEFTVTPVTAVIPPGGTQVFDVTFTPSGAGTFADDVVFFHNGNTSPDLVPVTGKGYIPGVIIFRVSPTSLDFGVVNVDSSAVMSLEVYTDGPTDSIEISSVSTTNPVYTVIPNPPTTFPIVIAAGGTYDFDVRFTPSVAGVSTGDVEFFHNTPGSPGVVPVTGYGYEPEVLVTSPNGGESWQQWSTYEITWTDIIPEDVSIELYKGGSFHSTISESIPSNGSYNWTIPTSIPNGSDYKIRIFSTAFPYLEDFSDDDFTITAYLPLINISPDTLLFGNVGVSNDSNKVFTIRNEGEATLEVNNIIVQDPFSVNKTNESLISGDSSWITVTFSPDDYYYFEREITIEHNGLPGSPSYVSVSGTGVAAEPIFMISPDSLSFGDWPINSGETSQYLTISNEGYANLEIYMLNSSDQAFWPAFNGPQGIQPGDSLVLPIHFSPYHLDDYSGTLTISHNGEYSPSEVNLSGTGVVGDVFNYPSSIDIVTSYSFEDITQTNNYQIIGLPGDIDRRLSDLIQGTYGEDWRAFWDEGSGAYLEYSQDPSKFYLKPGLGFWVISRYTININQTVSSVSLSTDKTYSILLHPEWNLITNPFEISVPWEAVQHLNSMNEVIHYYSYGYYTDEYLYPNKGYYFMNATRLDSLNIPYLEYYGALAKNEDEKNQSKIKLTLSEEENEYSSLFIGFSENAKIAYDENDRFAPPGNFEETRMVVINEKLETNYKQLYMDIRPEIGDGQEYKIQIINDNLKPLNLVAEGLKNFIELEIFLLDTRLNNFYNLKAKNQINITGLHKKNEYLLLIGSKSFIEEKNKEFPQREYELCQNYPNPFNPRTVIRFSLLEENSVTIKIYSILGELVKTLIDNKKYEIGTYEIEFDATGIPSGIYFYRINAGKLNETKKMILLK